MKFSRINKHIWSYTFNYGDIYLNEDYWAAHKYHMVPGKLTKYIDGRGNVEYYRPEYDADLINKKACSHMGLKTKWFEESC